LSHNNCETFIELITELTRLGSQSPNEDEAIDLQEDDQRDTEVESEDAEAKKKSENAKLVRKLFMPRLHELEAHLFMLEAICD
jgi:hypothetical protein